MTAHGDRATSSGTGEAGDSPLAGGSCEEVLCLFTCVGSEMTSFWCLLPHACWAEAWGQLAVLEH